MKVVNLDSFDGNAGRCQDSQSLRFESGTPECKIYAVPLRQT